MRAVFLAIVALLFSRAAWAQQSPDSVAAPLPVSLDRIREALNRPAPTWTLKFDVPSDFKAEVHEQQKLDDLMKSFDFRAGPVPAGGLYMYEQQRILNNPTSNPLAQPYAAFNTGELLTVTLESLAERYLIRQAQNSGQKAPGTN